MSLRSIAVVIPVYQESGNIDSFYERLSRVANAAAAYKWQFVFVNDGSSDNSFEVLQALAAKNKDVKVIDLSRNFGKEIALTAGVHEVDGVDAVICIDADLQHPPELIPKLIKEWELGAEIVVTVRIEFEKQALIKRIGSHVYYWLINRISQLNMVSQTTDFRLYDKKVISAFKHATERERMFRGIMDWMGFRRSFVEFKAGARVEGKPGYSYYKLWRLAINSITSFSLWPLRVAGYMGGLITGLSSLLLSWMILSKYYYEESTFTALGFFMVLNTLLIGIVLMSIGLVALYIGTIHTEVINRPLYIVRERINF